MIKSFHSQKNHLYIPPPPPFPHHTMYPHSEVFSRAPVTPHNRHFHLRFRTFAGKIALSSKTTGKCNHLVHFSCCQFVNKYLVCDMMNYHCLKVFGTCIRRIGKHSPIFCVCSEPECMAVPILSCAVFWSRAPSEQFFFLAIIISQARQVIS